MSLSVGNGVSRAYKPRDDIRKSNPYQTRYILQNYAGLNPNQMKEVGAGFWKDFGRGFKEGFTGTLGLAKDILPFVKGGSEYKDKDLMYGTLNLSGGNLSTEHRGRTRHSLMGDKGGSWWKDALSVAGSVAPLLLV